MKFKNLNEDQDLESYFDQIVERLGEEKALDEIIDECPIVYKFTFKVMDTYAKLVKSQRLIVLDAIKFNIRNLKPSDAVYKIWVDILSGVARANGLKDLYSFY